MTMTPPAQCLACSRLRPAEDPDTGSPLVGTCDAFPGGIPFEIAIGGDHRAARGDERNGLTFEQVDSDDAREAFNWWQRTFATATPEQS